MIVTDYYKFEKLQGGKSKQRIDCTASTGGYAPFEEKRNKQGRLFVYIGDNTHTRAGAQRKADLAITNSKGNHLSSVFTPDVKQPLAYGDVQHTSDAMLIVFNGFKLVNGAVVEGGEFEIFIARGQRNNRNQLYNLLCDGELDTEMQTLREQAKTEPK